MPTTLNSSSDLDQLIPHIEAAINNVNLWQYYVFDVQTSVKEVAAALDSGSAKAWSGEPVQGRSVDQLAQVVKSSPGMIDNYRAWSARFCTRVDSAVAAGFVQAAYPGDNATDLAAKWGKVIDVLNVDLYNECNDDVKAATDGVVGRLRFTRLEEGGPKMGAITKA